jgi:hypothetical protein
LQFEAQMKIGLALMLTAVVTASCSSSSNTARPSHNDAGGQDAIARPDGSGSGTDGGSHKPVSASIGATGGTVKTSDGTATLNVPAGAVGTAVTITIMPSTSSVPGAVGQVWEIGPTGTQFSMPVTLTLAYTDAEFGGKPAADFAVSTVVDNAWQPIAATLVNPSARTISGQTTHLSPYALSPMAGGGDAAGVDAQHDATVPMDAGHEAAAPVEADVDSASSAPACAPACADGNVCGAFDDCGSQVCTAGKCAVPACSPTCAQGANCGANGDCGSEVCKAGICGYPACAPSCLDGANCGEDGDCESDVCTAGKCAPPPCASMSGACPQGSKCGAAADCGSGVCETAGKCIPPACAPTCPGANACGAAIDCASSVCTAGKCS